MLPVMANTLDIDVRDLLGLFLGKDKGRIKNTSDIIPYQRLIE